MPRNGRHLLLSLVVLVVAAVLYLGGFVVFMRYHGSLDSMATGETVFTVPDTIGYQVFAVLYSPLCRACHCRIHLDARARSHPKA